MSAPAVPVLHIAEDVSPAAGGVPAVVRQLSRHASLHGARIAVLHVRGDGSDLADCAAVTNAPAARFGRAWAYGPALRRALARALRDARAQSGVAHVHGVWSAPQLMACTAAARFGVPSVLTVHGMLEPWLWDRQGLAVRWKKRAYWALLGGRGLARATIVHAITPLERDHLAKVFPRNEIYHPERRGTGAPLRAGGNQPRAHRAVSRPARAEEGRRRPDQGFRRRGTPLRLGTAHCRTAVVAGLRRRAGPARREGRSAKPCRFLRPVHGEDKARLLARAWVLAAPSHSEVAGLVNLEAGARGLPSITTFETGLSDWNDGGGLLVHPANPTSPPRSKRPAAGPTASAGSGGTPARPRGAALQLGGRHATLAGPVRRTADQRLK